MQEKQAAHVQSLWRHFVGIVHAPHSSISNSFQGQQAFMFMSFISYPTLVCRCVREGLFSKSNNKRRFTCYSRSCAFTDCDAYQWKTTRSSRSEPLYQVATIKGCLTLWIIKKWLVAMGLYLRNYEHWVCDTKTTEYTTVTAAVHSFRTVVYLLCGMYSPGNCSVNFPL